MMKIFINPDIPSIFVRGFRVKGKILKNNKLYLHYKKFQKS